MLGMTIDSLYFSDRAARNPIEFSSMATGSKQPEPQRPRVMVVDDERLIADTITEILEGAGFQVATAYDGLTALEAGCYLSAGLSPFRCPDA